MEIDDKGQYENGIKYERVKMKILKRGELKVKITQTLSVKSLL